MKVLIKKGIEQKIVKLKMRTIHLTNFTKLDLVSNIFIDESNVWVIIEERKSNESKTSRAYKSRTRNK